LETGSLAAERELIASWCGVRDGGGLGFASWEGVGGREVVFVRRRGGG